MQTQKKKIEDAKVCFKCDECGIFFLNKDKLKTVC